MPDGFELCAAREQAPLESVPFHRWTFPNGRLWTEFYRRDDGYLLRFPGLADFELNGDRLAVTCYPTPQTSPHTAEHLYLNQVQPLVLSHRGALVVHASAVDIDGAAVAFVGPSGAGKSTLAASFALAGHPFLTDDGLVLESDDSGFRALPSHPSIRLWEDSESALMAAQARRAPALEFTSKLRFLADEALVFHGQPSLLRRVYFLAEKPEGEVGIRPLGQADALMQWVKYSFLLDIEERPRLALHFEQVAELAKEPMHFFLDYPRQFEELENVRRAIVAHVREVVAA